MGPMPPKVQPEKSPPNAPATNGHTAFATALANSSQSISIFMYVFLSCCLLLLHNVVLCRMQCLSRRGKCREMRRSEAEGRFGEAEPEGCASIRAFRRVAYGLVPPYAVLANLRKMPGGF